MYIEHLAVWDYRNFSRAELRPSPEGVTLLVGPNGSGKTNLLEAIGYVASLRSFRASPVPSLVRAGCQHALVSIAAGRDGRAVQLEAEVLLSGRGRLRLNRQPVARPEDFVGALLVTVFSPDDIELVKGGPQARRDYLDAMLFALWPKLALAGASLERALRQRNALLRSAGGVLRAGMAGVLDVWDDKVAEAGEVVAAARERLVGALVPEVEAAYGELGGRDSVRLHYERSWDGGLLDALRRSRAVDLRRGVTGVGPQRDELQLSLDGLTARVQASQGQQRSLALALRLGGHALVTRRHGTAPVLLLDDVFSELDRRRSVALADCLPPGQVLLTTAGPVPAELSVRATAEVRAGSVLLPPPDGADGAKGSEGPLNGA